MANLKVSESIAIDNGLNSEPVFRAGDIVAYYTSSTPSGWVACDGQELSKTTYSALHSAIGTKYGETNGSGGTGTTHFRTPKLNDSSSTLPILQAYSFKLADPSSSTQVAHTHSISGVSYSTANESSLSVSSETGHNHTANITHNSATLPAHTHATQATSVSSNSAASSNTGNLQIINTGTNYEVALSNHSHTDAFNIAYGGSGTGAVHTHSGGSSASTNSTSANETHSHTSTLAFSFSSITATPPILTARFLIKL